MVVGESEIRVHLNFIQINYRSISIFFLLASRHVIVSQTVASRSAPSAASVLPPITKWKHFGPPLLAPARLLRSNRFRCCRPRSAILARLPRRYPEPAVNSRGYMVLPVMMILPIPTKRAQAQKMVTWSQIRFSTAETVSMHRGRMMSQNAALWMSCLSRSVFPCLSLIESAPGKGHQCN